MNYKKMILAILCMGNVGLSLMAMEEPRTLKQILEEDDVKALQELLRTRNINLNAENIRIPWPRPVSPLEVAVYYCSMQSVEFLLPFTTSDDLLLKALFQAIVVRPLEVSVKGRDPICRIQITDLLLKKAREAGIDIQSILDEGLRYRTAGAPNGEQVQFLLSLGADRTIRFLEGDSLIKVAQENEKSAERRVQSGVVSSVNWASRAIKYQELIKVLRTYAPDLKTRTALAILNQVREGKLAREYFESNPLPRDLVELIAQLASVDPEAEAAWIKIGMPAYPLPPEEQSEWTREVEDPFGSWNE